MTNSILRASKIALIIMIVALVAVAGTYGIGSNNTAFAEDVVSYTIEFTSSEDASTGSYTMETVDNIEYTYRLQTAAGSYYITDGTTSWNNGGTNYDVEAGTYEIVFNPSIVDTSTVSETKIEYSVVGLTNNNGSEDNGIMSTEDGINYTYEISTAAGSYNITDGTNVWDNEGVNFDIDAGRYTIKLTADAQNGVVISQEKVDYYIINAASMYDIAAENIMTTEDGVIYSYSYTGVESAVYFASTTDGVYKETISSQATQVPNGTSTLSYNIYTEEVVVETESSVVPDPEIVYTIVFSDTNGIESRYDMSSDDLIVYTYNMNTVAGSFYITDGTNVWDNGGANYIVDAGTYLVEFQPGIIDAPTVTTTKTDYYVMGLAGGSDLVMSTQDGITYTYQTSTIATSYAITDGTKVWDNGGDFYALEAGTYTIYFSLDDQGVETVTNEKTEYYMVGTYNLGAKDESSMMSTSNGLVYTITYTGAEIVVQIVGTIDTNNNVSMTENYTIPAGTTYVTYTPASGEVTLETVQYYFVESGAVIYETDENRFVTEDGITYKLEYTIAQDAQFYVRDNASSIWNNEGNYYDIEGGTSTITFIPMSEEGEYITVEHISDYNDTDNWTVLKIGTAEEFVAFAQNAQNDYYSFNLMVILTADIDLTGYEGYQVPIFCGYFDGTYHTIKGIEVYDSGTNMALFRYLTVDATLMRLTIEVEAAPSGAKESAAGLVGSNSGLVEDCVVKGSVSATSIVGGVVGTNEEGGIVSECINYASVDGLYQVGGVVGQNSGTILSCQNYGEINIGDKNLNTVVLFNGGIVGYNVGYVYDCENCGTVGNIEFGSYTGGVAGVNYGTVSHCGNSGIVYGQTSVGGVVGHHGQIPASESEVILETVTANLEALLGITADEVPNIEVDPVAEMQAMYLYNTGIVSGVSQVGGVAGVIYGEGESSYSVQVAYNSGEVFGTGYDIGGIAGQTTGAVIDCINVGSVYAEQAENVGGIVGNTASGSIQYCANMGLVKGASFVGGIAGIAYDIDNCYTYCMIIADGENIGSIAGYLAGTATFNYYVMTEDGNYGGIDGINYKGGAESITIEELFSQTELNETLVGFNAEHWRVSSEQMTYPQLASFFVESDYSDIDTMFAEVMSQYGGDSFSVIFMAEGVFVDRVWVAYNGALSLTDMPVVPEKDGYYGSWSVETIDGLTANMIVEAEYVKGLTTISSGGSNAVMMAEGMFHPDTIIVLTALTIPVPTDLEGKYTTYGAYKVEIQLNGVLLSLDDIKLKLYIGNVPDTTIAIFSPTTAFVETTSNGQYIDFVLDGTDTIMLLQSVEQTAWEQYKAYFIYSAIAVVVIVVIIMILRKVKKSKKKSKAEEGDKSQDTLATEETSIPEDATSSEVSEDIIIPIESTLPADFNELNPQAEDNSISEVKD